MPKEELVEGIRQALSRGEPIEKAMMSFYNSGYAKRDIEEAAAAAQSSGYTPSVPSGIQKVLPGVIQRVSAYGQKPGEKSGIVVTIVLSVVLVLLIGMLVSVILFKDKIISIFSSLF